MDGNIHQGLFSRSFGNGAGSLISDHFFCWPAFRIKSACARIDEHSERERERERKE